jgi:hypothetical protein
VTPTPTATAQPGVAVFRDDFENTGSGWPTGAAGVCNSGYFTLSGNGIYGIEVYAQNQICISDAPIPQQGDGVIQVAAASGDNSVYGLVFGLSSRAINANSRFYIFWVDSVGQRYALQKFDQGWINLTGSGQNAFVQSGSIQSGAAANLLKVRREGTEILLFVNNVFVERVVESSLPSGFVGLANWSAYNTFYTGAFFDNFAVNRVAQIYAEEYTNPGSGWAEGSIEICQAAYANGFYDTTARADYFCYFRAPAPAQPNGRFSVDADRVAGFYPATYGLFLGEDGTFGNAYVLLVQPDSQSYALAKLVAGQWFGITWDPANQSAWLLSPTINTGGATP